MAKKRRPTAEDRDIVDWIKALPSGEHGILIEDLRDARHGLGLSR